MITRTRVSNSVGRKNAIFFPVLRNIRNAVTLITRTESIRTGDRNFGIKKAKKMIEFNMTVIFLLGFLIFIIIIIGKEFEERCFEYVDYRSPSEKSTMQQQARVGGFIVFDYLSDVLWPGGRDRALAYKRSKKSSSTAYAGQQSKA